MKSEMSRRKFLENTAFGAAAALTMGYLLAGCENKTDGGPTTKGQAAKPAGEFKCDDVSALSDADKASRTSLAYVDKSPDPAKNCLNCSLYTQPTGGAQCGGCTVVKGPIHPQGYCNVWAPKPA